MLPFAGFPFAFPLLTDGTPNHNWAELAVLFGAEHILYIAVRFTLPTKPADTPLEGTCIVIGLLGFPNDPKKGE